MCFALVWLTSLQLSAWICPDRSRSYLECLVFGWHGSLTANSWPVPWWGPQSPGDEWLLPQLLPDPLDPVPSAPPQQSPYIVKCLSDDVHDPMGFHEQPSCMPVVSRECESWSRCLLGCCFSS